MMHAARKAGKPSFVYKNQKYVRSKTKTGLITYKKAGKATGGSVRTAGSIQTGGRRRKKATGGSVVSGGAMSEQGKAVNKYGRKATVIARKATNTIVNHGPEAMAKAQELASAVGGRVRRKRRSKKY